MKKHNRRSVRLKDYNYSSEGAYYATVCAGGYGCRRVVKNAQNRDVFGHVMDGKMITNRYGKIIDQCWNEIPNHFPYIELDEHIVMPNHIHGIITIRRGTACRAPTTQRFDKPATQRFGNPVSGSLSTIIRSFKSAVTKQINILQNSPKQKLWQRNYYDHVIRDEESLNQIREYIINNPANWDQDRENTMGSVGAGFPRPGTMKKIIVIALMAFLLTAPAFAGTKRADLAGKWYTDSPEALRAELESYLDAAKPKPIDGEIIGLISPHAGFVFSGPVAAYGFKAIEKQDIETVVVVGFSHKRQYDFTAILNEDAFETPLGMVKIDKPLTEALMGDNPKIREYPIAFAGENSLEMQIPFLQVILKDFKVVLLAIGEQSFENSRLLGEALYDALKDKEKYLILASTDMSHYLPYDRAVALDEKTISLIKEFNPDKLYAESLAEGHRLMCGSGAVSAVMIAAKSLGAERVEVLKYANSGDTAGDKDKVVGYLSAALVKYEIRNTKSETNPKYEILNANQGDENMLNEAQRKKMLKLARDSITHYLKTGKTLEVKEGDPVLNKEMGAFVTLNEHGKLRGCIGNMIGRGPFYLTVRDMAKEAATGDPRFKPVTLHEMKDIDIEISALSPMEKIDDPNIIEVGKHGVMVRGGFASGVYLPQVATETGWNREEFMNSLCGQKAGMAPDAWKKGECDIYIFTAEVFGEKNDK